MRVRFKYFLTFDLILIFYCDNTLADRVSNRNSLIDSFDNWYIKVNSEYQTLSAVSADLAWRQNIGEPPRDGEDIMTIATSLAARRRRWHEHVCSMWSNTWSLTRVPGVTQRRGFYLLCRGPNFTNPELSELTHLQSALSVAYSSARVCLPDACLRGEPDLERLMARRELTPAQRLWIWRAWHDTAGSAVLKYYPRFVELLNVGAARAGYSDIGEVWREELEIPNLEQRVTAMYQQLLPLYRSLHAVVRYALLKNMDQSGEATQAHLYAAIPAHLLGNMWAQDWSSLLYLLTKDDLDLNRNIQKKNWTVHDMVEKAEDFYISLGLPRMSDKFWTHSRFDNASSTADSDGGTCHGTAANMFARDDYRMMLCAERSMYDLYVMHHEMGHIQYYMAYKNLPPLLQDGASSAFQESVGDAIWLGASSPMHLRRLGILSDSESTNTSSVLLLLRHALERLPQIPYALLIDKFRWDVFRGRIKPDDYNSVFWSMSERLRGVIPGVDRDKPGLFDAGAKFHVPDNTPYIRYFLSYIIQIQMFKSMCHLSVFGKLNSSQILPFPLHECDIYGSREAGKKLSKMMQLGASVPWPESLYVLTGEKEISVEPLLEYFEPIYQWLNKQIILHDIPVGW